jgi:hypothetical protein
MPISVVMQDESGDRISKYIIDPMGVIAKSLPDLDDCTYSCVLFIDPYGNTVFNPLQAQVMLGEWDRLKESFLEKDAETLWADVRSLIVRCANEVHVYLWFIGD